MSLDHAKLHDIEIDGVDTNDYPDFCDAHISSATIENEDGTFRDATEEEIEMINEDTNFVYENVLSQLF